MRRNKTRLEVVRMRIHKRMTNKGLTTKYDGRPMELLSVFKEYIEMQITAGGFEQDHFKVVSGGAVFGSSVETHTEEHDVPLTIEGFCAHANMTLSDWKLYRDLDEYGLRDTIALIDETIKDDWITGAAVGAYNATIANRYAGLADKSDITLNPSIPEIITGMEVL